MAKEQRLKLQTLLQSLLPQGSLAYFQPPTNVELGYPCIIYTLDNTDIIFAGNKPYRAVDRYKVTCIDRDPDSDIRNKVAALPMVSFSTKFTADNLHHTVYTLYF